MSKTMDGAGENQLPSEQNKFIRFIKEDHRYVFLGTSVVALLGIYLSGTARSPFSILAPIYAVECFMYALLIAWLCVSAAAGVSKYRLKDEYAAKSVFKTDGASKVEKIGSWVIWLTVAVFVVDRIILKFFYIADYALQATSNPQNFVASCIYMLHAGRDVFAKGITTTIELSVFGTTIAFFLALLLVFLRLQTPDRADNDFVVFWKKLGCIFAKIYSSVVRGTPMMIQGLIIYFAGFGVLKSSGMDVTQVSALWSTFTAGLVTISLNSMAYMMEVLRGGIESVDKGQAEAARSLGLSQWQTMRKVIFPQGIKNAIPALSNELVVNIKDSSVLSIIGVFDLMFATTTVAGIYYRQMEVYVMAAMMYLVLTMVASRILGRLARHLDVDEPVLLSTSDMQAVDPMSKTAKNPSGLVKKKQVM